MRIAIIGSGIAGLTVAHGLHRQHAVTVFEAADYAGGHTNTVRVHDGQKDLAVDTGFIVYNDRTYPKFMALLEQLGVRGRPTTMSFSVKAPHLEYNGTTLNTLFAQRRNLISPRFWRMIRDILRFNREATAWQATAAAEDTTTLAAWLAQRRFSHMFREYYVIPMGAAIWSASRTSMLAFPFRFFSRFFYHHGMLTVDDRPQWYTVTGGSQTYVRALLAQYTGQLRLNTPVRGLQRQDDGVRITCADGSVEIFDQVVLACHADQALALLEDPSDTEREILGAMPFQANEAILHTDASVLPKRRLAWAAWNYHMVPDATDPRVAVTYNMNILQGLTTAKVFNVTLNDDRGIDPSKILRRIAYHHPLYTATGMAARARFGEISGQRRTHYCGAYWHNGFHEDGVVSGRRVLAKLGVEPF